MTNNTLFNQRANALADTAAKATLSMVARRRLTIPKAVRDAVAVVEELEAASKLADPSAPSLPTDPSKVASTLTDAAVRQVTALQIRKLASELHPAAIATVNASVRAAGTEWTNTLCDEATEYLATLRTAATHAPRVSFDQVANLNPDQFNSWTIVANAVRSLEEMVADRATLGQLMGEQSGSHWGSVLPIVAEVSAPPYSNPRDIGDGFREREEFGEVMKESDAILRWYRLLDLEARGWIRQLALAPAGHLLKRVLMVNSWPDAFWSTQGRGDGGETLARLQAENAHLWTSPRVLVQS